MWGKKIKNWSERGGVKYENKDGRRGERCDGGRGSRSVNEGARK